MTERIRKIPGPDHPITITPNPKRVLVKAGGIVIADTTRGITLREANYPPVQYLPREDVRMDLLQRSESHTYCPYKGEASYFTVLAGGKKSVDAVWTYEQPYTTVAEIKDRVAFYPTRVESISEEERR